MLTDYELLSIIQDFRKSEWLSVRLVHEEIDIQLTKRQPGQALPVVAAAPAHSGQDAVAPPASAPDVNEATVQAPAAAQTSSADHASGDATASAAQEGVEADYVCADTLGTFWVAPAPGADPFVQPGDHVEAGQQLAIVEVMKLMTEVLAPHSGTVVEVLADNAEVVAAGQRLFKIAR